MTAFTVDQRLALEAPLNGANVKSRSQGGRNLSYIEGWHAIAEANRIFGFDGWSRETVEIKCVSEREREIGQRKDQGWGVTYTAKVRVRVGDLVREGCGTGHGIDRDLGQAHESAIKEAETDGMKRALMTFGNQFGLALYDKEQANVTHEAAVDSKALFIERAKEIIAKSVDAAALASWWRSDEQKNARSFAGLVQADVDALKDAVTKRITALGGVQTGKAA